MNAKTIIARIAALTPARREARRTATLVDFQILADNAARAARRTATDRS